ncbi:MAG: putative membrane protein YdjX (TVP38/TMEM64 family) [Myxococcota bacterium]
MLLLLGLLVAGRASGLTSTEVAAQLSGPWGMVLSVCMMVLSAMSAFPAETVALANGAVFGPILGTVLTWSGGMLGAALAFTFAKRWAPPPGPVLQRVQAATSDPVALLAIRFIPLFPFFLVNYACGLAGVSRFRFAWTTALGILPLCVVLSGLGMQAVRDQRILLVLVVLAAVSGAAAVWRARR